MSMFIDRELVEFALPLERNTSILYPQNVLLWFGRNSIDIGAYCYLKRSDARRKRGLKGVPVDPSSFDKTRAEKFREILKYLSEQATSGRTRITTLFGITKSFFEFVDWCDANELQNALNNEESIYPALKMYVEHLWDRFQKDEITINTAAMQQNNILHFIEAFMELDDLSRGVRLIRQSNKACKTTPPPDEIEQGRVLALCELLFEDISSFVLDQKPYPNKLRMPEYLGWKSNFLWIFPTTRKFLAPHELDNRQKLNKANWAIDYSNGQLSDLETIVQHYYEKNIAKKRLETAKKRIAAANADHQHQWRRDIAMLAHNIFVLLFTANTAMNWSQVRNLKWNAHYEVGQESQYFREIKYRAGGRHVSFVIRLIFLSKFRRFLELRNYLLNDYKFEFLFMTFGADNFSAPKQMGQYILSSLYKTLRRIDPDIPNITSRAWRAAKSDWALRNSDISTTALLIQNSDETVKRHYATGSETLATEEMGNYFEQLSKFILGTDRSSSKEGEQVATGTCLKYGFPKMNDNTAPIKPDCKQPEGCLFCDKYAVHADECDVRKLLSCRFCIFQTNGLSASVEHFQSLFGKIITRIDDILKHIENISDEHKLLVNHIRLEVEEEGRLDPYWEGKLEMLIGLGIEK